MTRVGARWVGTGMTACATLLALVAHGILAPEPVGASECCQVCEAKEAACYDACEQMSHEEGDDDSLSACYNTCDEELYYAPYGCWAHCSYCQPPNPQQCFKYVVQHYTGSCLLYNQHWECIIWQTLHDITGWLTSCAP